MAGTAWNTFTPGTVAKSSEVNSNFDWLEGSLAPMTGGAQTNGVYDLGTTTAAWRNLFLTGHISLNGDTISSFDGSTIEATNGVITVRTAGITGTQISNLSAVTAYSNSATSVAMNLSATAFRIPFNIELFDLGGEFDGFRFTANATGYYHIDAHVGLSGQGAGTTARILLRKNGGTTQFSTYLNTLGSAQLDMHMAATFSLNATDYVEIFGLGTSAGATGPTILAGASADSSVSVDGAQTFFSIRRIL